MLTAVKAVKSITVWQMQSLNVFVWPVELGLYFFNIRCNISQVATNYKYSIDTVIHALL